MECVEKLIIPPDKFSFDYDNYYLVADIGGTKSIFALFGVKEGKNYAIFTLRFPSQAVSEFTDMINITLEKAHSNYRITVDSACFGFAGPIFDGRTRAELTNLPWKITTDDVFSKTKLKNIAFINDFEAIGYGIEMLPDSPDSIEQLPSPFGREYPVIQKGEKKAVFGPGTGLGHVFLVWNRKKQKYDAESSEAQHAVLPSVSELHFELCNWLVRNNLTDNAAWPVFESVLSGRGIHRIYSFLREKNEFKHDPSNASLIDSADDKSKMISKLAHENTDDLLNKTWELFFEFLAIKAHNLAIETLCFGGLYIAGGIIPKNMGLLRKSRFMHIFKELTLRHNMNNVLDNVPVFVIKDFLVGLYGTLNVAVNFIEDLGVKKNG